MKKIISAILIFIYLFTSTFAFYEDFDFENDEEFYLETAVSTGVPTLNARAAILYDATFDRILYEKNARQKRANASTTKMITAIVAYEEGDINDIVTVSKNAASVGGSVINLRKDDKASLDSLINGLLIHSGNDAAVAIAEHIAGSVEEFSNIMNEKALEIGAKDTHFVTPHGLDKEEHYSTAYDLMLIANYLLKIPYLANIVSKKSVEIEVNGYNKTVGTTNEMLSIYDGVNGVKTGFTANAGRCIVTSVNRDSRKLISVVLGCDTKKNRTIDSVKLLNYGFESYKLYDFSKHIKQNLCISVEKSEGKLYMLSKNVTFVYPLKDDEIKDINVRYNIKANLVAPVYKGEKVATAGIYIGQNKIRRNWIRTSEWYFKKKLAKLFWGFSWWQSKI